MVAAANQVTFPFPHDELEEIAVFRNGDDEVFALRDKCPHKGGPLSQGIVHGRLTAEHVHIGDFGEVLVMNWRAPGGTEHDPRGDILSLGRNISKEMASIKAELPLGIEPTLVADQAVTVDVAIGDFMASLWQAILIILVCSFVSLGVRPGTVVALAIPLTLAIVFAIMNVAHIDLHRISLGALIIALTLLVDDAMTTVDVMTRRLEAGDSIEDAASFAYTSTAFPT